MKNLAIIPARGGSKRLLKKNLRKLYDKPLVQYTIEAVVNSDLFDKIILSSDDQEILEVGEKFENVSPMLRSANLSSDTRKVIDLVKVISTQEEIKDTYDTIGLFLPTCPFRTSHHIREGMKMLTKDIFSVVSITEMQDPVQLSLTVEEDDIINPEAIMNPSPLITGDTRSQDFKKLYRVNGGFYLAWLNEFLKRDNFFQGKVKGYYMDRLHSVDVDYQLDLEWAEYLLNRKHVDLG